MRMRETVMANHQLGPKPCKAEVAAYNLAASGFQMKRLGAQLPSPLCQIFFAPSRQICETLMARPAHGMTEGFLDLGAPHQNPGVQIWAL